MTMTPQSTETIGTQDCQHCADLETRKRVIAWAPSTYVAIATLLCWALCGGVPAVATEIVAAEFAIPNQYIVLLEDGVARRPGQSTLSGPSVAELAQSLAGVGRGSARRSFEHAIAGFVLVADEVDVRQLAKDARVANVFEDSMVGLAGTQVDPSWALDRIDQRSASLDALYTWDTNGDGVHFYPVDTGVRSTHSDFGGRVDTAMAFSSVADGFGTEDCHGHGTAVTGLASGALYGVAKAVTIHPVRVLDCQGLGSISDVIAGIDWVIENHQAPAVMNISLGTGAYAPFDSAVQAAINAGIPVVVAAGNANNDACSFSPARVADAITVGASDSSDNRASFSNHGYCLDLFAPGIAVETSTADGDTASSPFSGTSAAAPQVAGAIALYLAENPGAGITEIEAVVSGAASPAIAADGTGSTDLLLYSRLTDPSIDLPPIAAYSYTCRRRRCSFDGRASSDDRGIVYWQWLPHSNDPGSIIEGAKKNRAHYRHPDHLSAYFAMELTVWDETGQTATWSRWIRVDP